MTLCRFLWLLLLLLLLLRRLHSASPTNANANAAHLSPARPRPPTNQPVSQSVSQPVSQSASQPASQPTNKPTNPHLHPSIHTLLDIAAALSPAVHKRTPPQHSYTVHSHPPIPNPLTLTSALSDPLSALHHLSTSRPHNRIASLDCILLSLHPRLFPPTLLFSSEPHGHGHRLQQASSRIIPSSGQGTRQPTLQLQDRCHRKSSLLPIPQGSTRL